MKASREDRVDLFDRWAKTYDRSVGADSFPLAGYDDILDTIARLAEIEPDHRFLDVGIGAGALAERIAASGCELWGVDFSEEMLKRARAKLPTAHLVRADLLDGWPEGLPDRFDRVVSAYVFHEFADDAKLRLIEDLAGRVALDGRIVIGDVAFPDARAMDECRRAWRTAWDEAEHYWTAESMQRVLEDAGFTVKYEQVSFCGGVFSLQRATLS
jgi:cyclopropane fatty-acyl-phospholipid synthase-like methyltransferase